MDTDLVGSSTLTVCHQWPLLLLTFYTAKNKINRKYIHMSLLLSGLGFIYMFFTPSTLMYSFILIGFLGKYFIHAVCYAFECCKSKNGNDDGSFNMFIVIPQIIAALVASTFY
jgi:maltose/moltooligosaccharide transporter